MSCEVLAGRAAGLRDSTAVFTTWQVYGSQYLITWQEDDGGTVVHLDNFEKGLSFSHYTNGSYEFFVMDGRICESAE